MGAVEIAGLLKDYGLVGAVAILCFVISILVTWLKGSWQARLDDKQVMLERVATALERQSSTNVENTETVKELREGQGAILKTVTESAITGAAADKAILKEIESVSRAVDRNTGARAQ